MQHQEHSLESFTLRSAHVRMPGEPIDGKCSLLRFHEGRSGEIAGQEQVCNYAANNSLAIISPDFSKVEPSETHQEPLDDEDPSPAFKVAARPDSGQSTGQ